MDIKLINEITDCLPKERTLFRYFKDRYAFILLSHVIGNGEKVSQLRKTVFSGLLDKPVVKKALASAGQGCVTPEILNSIWPEEIFNFVLTLGKWEGNCHRCDQTSRRGYNLVLQLNFSMHHDQLYKKMVKPEFEALLNNWGHPVLEPDDRSYYRETLAWARIDLDFVNNEALIEEIQNDWLREAERLLKDAKYLIKDPDKLLDWWGTQGRPVDVIRYCEQILKPYKILWDEAMLSSAIQFIVKELGIRNIYCHSESTGYRIKGIRYRKPPRSVYSQLPRRFCFSKTNNAPEFLFQDKQFRRIYKKIDNPEWYHMAL